MSMHRGAQIIAGIAAAGYTNSTPTVIPAPNGTAAGNVALQKVQGAASSNGETLTTAYTVTITAGNGATETFTTGQTPSGRFIVSDSAGNVVSYPT